MTRPPAPVAATASSLTPASRATLRAVGVARTSRCDCTVRCGSRVPQLAVPTGAACGLCTLARWPWRRHRRHAIERREHFANLDVLALGVLDGDSTPARSALTSRSIFSVSSSTSGSPIVDVVAFLLQPLGDARFDDGFAELGHDDVGHFRTGTAECKLSTCFGTSTLISCPCDGRLCAVERLFDDGPLIEGVPGRGTF